MQKLLLKVAIFLAYVVFAGWSAWMTATSIQLKWMNQMPIWFVIIMVFTISLLAGWLLSNYVIKELRNPINPSKSRFFFALLGFLLFWGISFMTNVHYNVIQEHGVSNLHGQLSDFKSYLNKHSKEAAATIKEEQDKAIQTFEQNIHVQRQRFVDELGNPLSGGSLVGFGPQAKSRLQDIEQTLATSAKLYGDSFDYNKSLYKSDKEDDEYGNFHGRKEVNEIVKPHFTERIDHAVELHKKAIISYYQNKIDEIANNQNLLRMVSKYEESLNKLEENPSTSYIEYYNFYQAMDKQLLSQAKDYLTANEIYKTKDGEKVLVGYRVYPSNRMFNFWDVWKDWFNGSLPDNISLAGQFAWSIIVDAVAFILICLIF